MSRIKKISRLGETAVQQWAETVDAVVNSSDPDEFGWDKYVEFQPTGYQLSSAGIHTSPLKCKIQVKATDDINGNRSPKLSSIRHIVVDPLPAFYYSWCLIKVTRQNGY